MKIIVDKLPDTSSECPFSEWYPFGAGGYKCTLVKRACDLNKDSKECRILKENDK